MRFIRFVYFGTVGLLIFTLACTSPIETKLLKSQVGTQELYFDQHDKTNLTWSPDSTLLAYQTAVNTAIDSQYSTIFVYNLLENVVQDITADDHHKRNCYPTFVTDSKSILFTQNDQLYKMSLVNGERSPVTPSNDPPQFHPNVSPDGQLVVFDDGTDIYAVSIDGGPPQKLSESVTFPVKNPSWSPDGTKLACESPGQLAIFTFESTGITLDRKFAGSFIDIEWAGRETPPFGCPILFRNSPGVAMIDPVRGDIFDAFFFNKNITSYCWAPNGRDIAFSTPRFIYLAPMLTTIE